MASHLEISASPGLSVVLFPVAGLVVVGVLVAAFLWGRRLSARESPKPLPEEQPQQPKGGPVFETSEFPEPRAVPRRQNGRLTPHQMKGYGRTRASEPGNYQE
ncbi:DUF6479 family protein [Streptomyces sp. NBC_00859]|uniref:DUF6479 family protein n=1 Tax=Streptomyces sp. NBC_00859 TaxID=2903682 RepID=UPI00386CE81A|nr:DUF6479 family protein [Streptomyces sp. NBC_00859]